MTSLIPAGMPRTETWKSASLAYLQYTSSEAGFFTTLSLPATTTTITNVTNVTNTTTISIRTATTTLHKSLVLAPVFHDCSTALHSFS